MSIVRGQVDGPVVADIEVDNIVVAAEVKVEPIVDAEAVESKHKRDDTLGAVKATHMRKATHKDDDVIQAAVESPPWPEELHEKFRKYCWLGLIFAVCLLALGGGLATLFISSTSMVVWGVLSLFASICGFFAVGKDTALKESQQKGSDFKNSSQLDSRRNFYLMAYFDLALIIAVGSLVFAGAMFANSEWPAGLVSAVSFIIHGTGCRIAATVSKANLLKMNAFVILTMICMILGYALVFTAAFAYKTSEIQAEEGAEIPIWGIAGIMGVGSLIVIGGFSGFVAVMRPQDLRAAKVYWWNFAINTFLVVATIVFLGGAIKGGVNAKDVISDNCGEILHNTNEQWFDDLLNCDKYYRIDDQCNLKNETDRAWEYNIGKSESEKQDRSGCLDSKCCDELITKIYSIDVYVFTIGFVVVATLAITAVIARSLYNATKVHAKDDVLAGIRRSKMYGLLLLMVLGTVALAIAMPVTVSSIEDPTTEDAINPMIYHGNNYTGFQYSSAGIYLNPINGSLLYNYTAGTISFDYSNSTAAYCVEQTNPVCPLIHANLRPTPTAVFTIHLDTNGGGGYNPATLTIDTSWFDSRNMSYTIDGDGSTALNVHLYSPDNARDALQDLSFVTVTPFCAGDSVKLTSYTSFPGVCTATDLQCSVYNESTTEPRRAIGTCCSDAISQGDCTNTGCEWLTETNRQANYYHFAQQGSLTVTGKVYDSQNTTTQTIQVFSPWMMWGYDSGYRTESIAQAFYNVSVDVFDDTRCNPVRVYTDGSGVFTATIPRFANDSEYFLHVDLIKNGYRTVRLKEQITSLTGNVLSIDPVTMVSSSSSGTVNLNIRAVDAWPQCSEDGWPRGEQCLASISGANITIEQGGSGVVDMKLQPVDNTALNSDATGVAASFTVNKYSSYQITTEKVKVYGESTPIQMPTWYPTCPGGAWNCGTRYPTPYSSGTPYPTVWWATEYPTPYPISTANPTTSPTLITSSPTVTHPKNYLEEGYVGVDIDDEDAYQIVPMTSSGGNTSVTAVFTWTKKIDMDASVLWKTPNGYSRYVNYWRRTESYCSPWSRNNCRNDWNVRLSRDGHPGYNYWWAPGSPNAPPTNYAMEAIRIRDTAGENAVNYTFVLSTWNTRDTKLWPFESNAKVHVHLGSRNTTAKVYSFNRPADLADYNKKHWVPFCLDGAKYAAGDIENAFVEINRYSEVNPVYTRWMPNANCDYCDLATYDKPCCVHYETFRSTFWSWYGGDWHATC